MKTVAAPVWCVSAQDQTHAHLFAWNVSTSHAGTLKMTSLCGRRFRERVKIDETTSDPRAVCRNCVAEGIKR